MPEGQKWIKNIVDGFNRRIKKVEKQIAESERRIARLSADKFFVEHLHEHAVRRKLRLDLATLQAGKERWRGPKEEAPLARKVKAR